MPEHKIRAIREVSTHREKVNLAFEDCSDDPGMSCLNSGHFMCSSLSVLADSGQMTYSIRSKAIVSI